MMRGDDGASSVRSSSEGHSPYPRLAATSRQPAGSHSQEDTLLILAVFSLQGCRFCKANRELFCKHSGSGVTGWLMVFWKASCCSCMRILLACCRSASRSSAVCRLQRQHVQYGESWHHRVCVFLRCPRLGSCHSRQPSWGYLAMDTVCLFVFLKGLIFKTLIPNKLDTV